MSQTCKNHQNAKVAKKQGLAKRKCGQNANVTQAHLLQNAEVAKTQMWPKCNGYQNENVAIK